YVDPKSPDIVYTLATCMYRSLDGGKTFEAYKGAPGGDDPQQLWIDPTDGSRMLLGGDQGAAVSLDAGATWGSWYNQPTGQFYHIGVDNQWPYWVYGTQQDSGAIGTSTRGNLGEITPNDWTPHPGSEGGPMLVDPLDPKITYCLGPGGLIRVIFPSGQWTPINPPERMGEEVRDPSSIEFSAGDPHEMLAGAQFLLSTKDRGASWQKLSDDLTLVAGDKTPASASRATIFAISVSPLDAHLIWIGTDNGLIKATQDHGKTWTDVSLPAADRRPVVNIEASGVNKAEAYAVTNARQGKVRLIRTRDFGKTWTDIDGALPPIDARSFPYVLRSDRKREGLLFLAAGRGVFYSIDDGDHWQPMNLNLPVTVVSDLIVHGDDLVIATYGRGIWILDNFSPLREISPATMEEPVHLFKPATAIRVRRSLGEDTPFPPEVPHAENPPLGAVIDYSLASKPAGAVALEILDRDGQVVRHMSSAPIEPYTDPKPAVPDFWFETRSPLPTEIGLNRVTWNLRYDTPPAVFHDPSYYGEPVPHATPFAMEGPLAPPGTYTARLTVDGKAYSQPITVVNDPRSPGTQREMEALHEVQMRLYLGVREAWDGYRQTKAVRAAIASIMTAKPADEVAKAARALNDKLAAVEGSEVRGMFFLPESTKDFIGLNQHLLNSLDGLDSGDNGPTEAVKESTAEDWSHLKSVAAQWRALQAKDLVDFNALLARYNLKPIQVTGPALVDPPAPPKRYLPPPEPPKSKKG
ncbi:MAG TPA: YCF48-related protein, partial [Fimbriimonadaceae bacterium]|nr:YCF48-related protein [Fimbriimonadaceae bacterium]